MNLADFSDCYEDPVETMRQLDAVGEELGLRFGLTGSVEELQAKVFVHLCDPQVEEDRVVARWHELFATHASHQDLNEAFLRRLNVLRAIGHMGAKLDFGLAGKVDHTNLMGLHPRMGTQSPRTIVLGKVEFLDNPTFAGAIVFELAPICLARILVPFSIRYTYLGWEFLVAREYGLLDEWLAVRRTYRRVDEPYPFGQFSLEEQSDRIEQAVTQAQDLGFLDPEGLPLKYET